MIKRDKYAKISVLLLIAMSVFMVINGNRGKKVVNKNELTLEERQFAIYKDDGSGNYAISSDASFPTKGYILNMDKTKCFDSNNSDVSNSIVSQSLDGKITLSATVSTYCDLYFTKDSTIPVVKSFSVTGKDANGADLTNGYTYNNEVTYKVEWLDTDVTHYCLTTNPTSCDQTWIETNGLQSISVSNSTFTSTDGAHTIYVYLKDKAQNVSSATDISKKTITVDRTAPSTPTFSIMGKTTGGSNLNGDYSQVVGVGTTLTWSGDVKDYCITTSATCSSNEWKNATTTPSITLPSSEGNKTYNAYVRDNANNVSGKATDSILLDLNNPSVSKVTYKSKDTSSITVKVEGTDGTTGSGITKYECKATTQDTWFTQVGDTCKVTGLNDGTEYTIEGRVTDASGRVSTNSVSTTQSTEAAYSCSAGEEMIQDASKGSTSEGYICKASASSKGWSKEETYWTCSTTGSTRYASQSSAVSACRGAVKGSCSRVGHSVYHPVNYLWGKAYDTFEEAKQDRLDAGYDNPMCRRRGSGAGSTSLWWYQCSIWNDGYNGIELGYPATRYDSYDECASAGCSWSNFSREWTDPYYCDMEEEYYEDESDCSSSCQKNGSVSSSTLTSYYCDVSTDWYDYSGDGSSLQCYRAASKG